MDRLDQAIREKERELAELTRKVDWVRAHLEGLRTAAELLPEGRLNGAALKELGHTSATSGGSAGARGRRGGRQHGTLTGPYRKLASAMVARGNKPMDTFAISALARDIGLDLPPKRAGDRMRKYTRVGVAERVGDEYCITPATITRYAFKTTAEPSPEVAGNGSA